MRLSSLFRLALLAAGPMAAPGAASAEEVIGFLRVAGAQFDLRHGYAVEEVDLGDAIRADERDEVLGRDRGEQPVIMFLTNEPIPDDARGDLARIQELVARGDIRGLEVQVDPLTRNVRWTGRLLVGGELTNQVFRRRQDRGGDFDLIGFSKTGGNLRGALRSAGEFGLLDGNGEVSGDSFSFAVEFDLEAEPAPEETNRVSGDDAANTPQTEILLSAMTALRENDIAAFKQLAASNSEIAFLADGPDEDAYRESLLEGLPGDAEDLRDAVEEIVFYGDRAVLTTGGMGGEARAFIFIREAGQWKLAQG
jgi:hypothetical protein